MALIDISYFFNEFNVAQKSHDDVSERLKEYIENYEPEYIEKALGEDFAALFNAHTTPGRFDDLQAMLVKQPSPIAGYVFFHYQRDDAIRATGSGDAKSTPENASRSPEVYRMVKGWNIMAKKTRKIQKYLLDNKDTFPEFNLYDTDCSLIETINAFGI